MNVSVADFAKVDHDKAEDFLVIRRVVLLATRGIPPRVDFTEVIAVLIIQVTVLHVANSGVIVARPPALKIPPRLVVKLF